MIVLPNHGTDMMCQNTFGGKMIISFVKIKKKQGQESSIINKGRNVEKACSTLARMFWDGLGLNRPHLQPKKQSPIHRPINV